MSNTAVQVILLVLVSSGLLGGLLYFVLKPKLVCQTEECSIPVDKPTICLTPDCTAAMLIDTINASVDPCQDFYEFSCGQFHNKFPRPDFLKEYSMMLHYTLHTQLEIRDALKSLDIKRKPVIIQKVKEFYLVCMNSSKQPEKEWEGFSNYSVIILQWPLAYGKNWLDKYDNLSRNISHYLLRLESIDIKNPYFDIEVVENEEYHVKITALSIGQFFWKDDKHSYVGNDGPFNKATTKFIKELARLFNNADKDSIEEDLEDMKSLAQYEHERRKNLTQVQERRDEIVTIELLSKLSNKNINWLQLFNWILKKRGIILTKDDKVKIQSFENLLITFEIIQRYPFRVLNNIGAWNKLLDMMIFAGPTGESLYYNYKREAGHNIFPMTPPGKKWMYCLHEIQFFFPIPFTRIFVDEFVDKDQRKSVEEMTRLLQEAYKKLISNSEWLDRDMKLVALRKAELMKRYIGHSDNVFDDEKLDKLYKDLPDIVPVHFFNELHYLSIYGQPRLDGKMDNNDIVYPLAPMIYYVIETNTIWYPVAYLQLPFYHSSRMAAVNFGMVGTAIAQMMMQAFYELGSEVDENENEWKWNWWSNEVLVPQIYVNKTNCFAKQYNKFCLEEWKDKAYKTCDSGHKTSFGDIADLSGLQAALIAYKFWITKYGLEKRLPGLQQYSPEQIFFISYAHSLCETSPNDYSVPSKYRVLSALSNNEDFRTAFQCSEGPMNRAQESCSVW